MAIGYICSAGIEEKQLAFALGNICWFAFSYPQWVVFQHGNVLYRRYPTCSTYYIDLLYVPKAGQHSFADYLISALGRGVPRLLNSFVQTSTCQNMSKLKLSIVYAPPFVTAPWFGHGAFQTSHPRPHHVQSCNVQPWLQWRRLRCCLLKYL